MKTDKDLQVWIHSGSLVMGGSAARYNQNFFVQQAAEAGMLILAVSINHRLSSWGFLYGKAIQDSGHTMNDFRDQRLALHWVQENIEAFGGDPSKVTIQGESSGGNSVGAHLLAYDGRDDKLFAHAIAESGGSRGSQSISNIQRLGACHRQYIFCHRLFERHRPLDMSSYRIERKDERCDQLHPHIRRSIRACHRRRLHCRSSCHTTQDWTISPRLISHWLQLRRGHRFRSTRHKHNVRVAERHRIRRGDLMQRPLRISRYYTQI